MFVGEARLKIKCFFETKKKHFIFNQTNNTLTLKLGLNKKHFVLREIKNIN